MLKITSYPYSYFPDAVICNYFIFLNLNMNLRGRRFVSGVVIDVTIGEHFDSTPEKERFQAFDFLNMGLKSASILKNIALNTSKASKIYLQQMPLISKITECT